MVQDDTGGAVERAVDKDGIKGRGNGAEQVTGETGRPRQLDLAAQVPKLLGAQEDERPLRVSLYLLALRQALSMFFTSWA